MKHTTRAALACVGTLASLVSALNPIEVQSQDFVDSASGKRFEIIGVDYQPGGEAGFNPANGEDPLSNGDTCLRDAALMQRLGINTIRTYNVDPDLNHDECLSIFDAVGIYVLVDVNSPLQGDSINRADPSSTYGLPYLNRTFAVLDAFRNYPNVIGFFSGNEIVNDDITAGIDPPYIRAVTRDLKQYLAARGGRSIPVGYSAADVRDILVDTSNYLQCTISSENDVSSRSDFFALNSYSWCGPDANFDTSTYDDLAADFAATTMPVFFSEYGCIVPAPRYFNEVPVLYGPLMTTWSGGLVYQWTEEGSPEGQGYGLIRVAADSTVTITQDYGTLMQQYASLNYTLIESQNVTAQELTPPECGASLITTSSFSTDFDLPAQPNGVADLISSGIQNANVGNIISITRTTIDIVVTQANGETSQGLTITSVTSANRPNTATDDSSQPTGDSSNSDDDPNAAPAALLNGSLLPLVSFSIASMILALLI